MSDDDIAEIRARHEQVPSGNLSIAAISLAHADRATLLAEVDRLRADNERLRKVYVLIATESAGIVEGGSIFEDKIAGCYASHQSADKAGENLGYVNWRIEEHKIISNALEGKP